MNILILIFSIILSLIPIFIIANYFYRKDTIKEPFNLLNKLFISGIISAIIAIFVSILGLIIFPKLNNPIEIKNIFLLIIYSYIFIATIEESTKLIMIYIVGYNNKNFDQAYDIILYSVFVALGFACMENFIYLSQNPNFNLAILRGITAVPSHICFQIIMGYYLYLSKINKRNYNIFKGLLKAILVHGTYDFLIFTGSTFLIVVDFVLILIILIYNNNKINKLLEFDKKNIL